MENMLAKNIRDYRKRLELTQEQLAERLGITLGAVSKWERGSSEPDLSYIMDLAELFHVSVDALIGFSMRGTDADREADRIDELGNRIAGMEADGGATVLDLAGEYERALKKFPNHFRIVFGAAMTYRQIGVVYKKDAEMKKALELYRHAIDLISQNTNPQINEAVLRNEIAGCWSTLKDYKRAIEEYKKNNLTGSNDARIGMLYTQFEKKPEEGIEYTERSFFRHISDLITVMAGYMAYYGITSKPEQGSLAAGWAVRFLESLKEDPDKRSYLDKIACLFQLDLAVFQDLQGLPEASDESLRQAVRTAAVFDSDPVFTLENFILRHSEETTVVYDDTGPTATEGLRNMLQECSAFVSDAFLEKFEQIAGRAQKP